MECAVWPYGRATLPVSSIARTTAMQKLLFGALAAGRACVAQTRKHPPTSLLISAIFYGHMHGHLRACAKERLGGLISPCRYYTHTQTVTKLGLALANPS